VTPSPRTWLRTSALSATLIFAVAGCSVGSQSTARRTAPDDVPFELLEAPSPTSPAPNGRAVEIYLVREGRLVTVDRTLAPNATIDSVLQALSDGPTAAEQAFGVGSPLPPGQIGTVEPARGVALVDLNISFGDLASEDQGTAIGQIVYTLTARPGIGSVSFTLDGNSIEVPSGDGALTTDALARDDFPGITPR